MFNVIRKKMNKKGFTLVELLVVIAVLGIIAGIAIPRMSGVTDSFKYKADVQSANNLARQVELKIQMGDIVAPTKADFIIVGFTVLPKNDKTGKVTIPAADAPQHFGEAFTDSPASGGSFLIEMNDDYIKITAKSGKLELYKKKYGGVIK